MSALQQLADEPKQIKGQDDYYKIVSICDNIMEMFRDNIKYVDDNDHYKVNLKFEFGQTISVRANKTKDGDCDLSYHRIPHIYFPSEKTLMRFYLNDTNTEIDLFSVEQVGKLLFSSIDSAYKNSITDDYREQIHKYLQAFKQEMFICMEDFFEEPLHKIILGSLEL
jgi:hypothetical protein